MLTRSIDKVLKRYRELLLILSGNRLVYRANITFCVCLFLSIMAIQARLGSQDIGGVLAQVQVLVSVYLCVTAARTGYILAVVLNGMTSLLVAHKVVFGGLVYAVPGIVVPLNTIVLLTVIFVFMRRLNQNLLKNRMQKEKMIVLYKELSANKEALVVQNKLLLEYTQLMRENEQSLKYLANYDSLTELPNRNMINQHINQLILLSTANSSSFSVVFIDLDNFKKINDSFGHHVGDLLLREIANQLKRQVSQGDMIGRLGGDEFALVIQQELSPAEILTSVEKVRGVFENPFLVNTDVFLH